MFLQGVAGREIASRDESPAIMQDSNSIRPDGLTLASDAVAWL
jgi:hypothetical protein